MATRPIDEKIVAMKMDNSDFINKASETTKTMGKLTSFLNKIPGINLGKTASEFQNINKSVNGIEMGRLSGAIDSVTSRFSNLGIVGTTALMNITNRAVDAGIQMAKNFTIKPINDGFKEYELQMGSIQTILANTSKYGTNVGDVTAALDELNEYADKTIYNFGEMTKNIGLFTNAGLELDASVSMIKGFSNAAAASGANAEGAARAAFQLSQGLSQGYLMQMDWMSLTNAGMGNDNMKRDLIALGQAMGTLTVDTETAVTDWKALLSDEKWLTTDVMSTYLQSMAGELDKATLMTIGLSEAQADLLIQNAKIGEESATYVRTFTQMIGTIAEGIGSGWSESWKIIFGDFNHATKLWTGFKDLIGAPFDALTKSRNNLLQFLKDSGVFEEVFVGIGTAIYLVGQVVESVANGFDKAFSSDRAGSISKFTEGFKKVVSALTPSQKTLDSISIIFEALGSTIRVVMKILGDVAGLFMRLIPDNLGTNVLGLVTSLAKMVISFNSAILTGKGVEAGFNRLGTVFSWIGDRISYVVSRFVDLGKIISEVWGVLKTGEAVTNGSFDEDSNVVKWLTAISAAAKSVIKYIGGIDLSIAPVKNAFKTFFSTIGAGFDWIKEKTSAVAESIQSMLPKGTTLMAGGFVASLMLIVGVAFKRMNELSKIFGGFGKIVDGFAETIESVGGVLDAFSLNLHANSLLIAAFAVGALAASIFLLSKVDGSKIGTSLTGLVGSLMAVIGSLAIMSKYNIAGNLMTSATIIGIAIALSVMSVALKKFGNLNPGELTKGLIGITVVMAGVAGAFALMGKFNDKDMAIGALQIIAMSVAVLIIAKAVEDMSSMKPEQLATGIYGLAGILLAISGAFAIMGKFSGGGASALQFVAMAGSILMLVGAIKTISTIESSDLLIGLGVITAILGAITGFSILTSGKGLLASSVGLLAISAAMNALIIPIFAMGNFPIDNLLKGLLGMSVVLLALAGASKLMSGSLLGVVGIIAMSVALNLLLIPLSAFAAMGWSNMLTGVAGIALSLGALALASILMAPAAPILLVFAAAIGLMGVAMLAAGAGMTLFSTGLIALATMTAAAITTIVGTIGAMIAGLTTLIPIAVKFVANIIIQIVEAIRDYAPKIINIITEAIVNILTAIAENVPKFIKAVVKVITAILDALAEEGPKLVDSAVKLLISLVETMAKTIDENGHKFVNAFLGVIGSVLSILVEAGTSVVGALFGWIPGVEKAMGDVGQKATTAIDTALDSAKLGEDKTKDLADGMSKNRYLVERASEEVGKTAETGLAKFDATAAGGKYTSTFATGMLLRKDLVANASTQLANTTSGAFGDTLGINSDAKVGIWYGGHWGGGVATGITGSTGKVESASSNMASSVIGSFSSITDGIRGKLILSDEEVAENEKNTSKVTKANTDATKANTESSKTAINNSKNLSKAQTDSSEKINKALDKQFENSKAWIEEQKYYLKMSTDQELRAWQTVQQRYKAGTEERRLADREVFRLQQAIIQEKAEAEKKAFSDSKAFIDKQKTYKEMSLAQELTAWTRVQNDYKAGTEERKEADREVLRLKNEINQKLVDLNETYVDRIKSTNQKLIDDERRLNDEYKRTYDDRVKSLTSFIGLFDKVKEKDAENPVTGDQLISNLRGQVNSLSTWSDDLQRLAQKGVNEGLLKELEEMGPGAALEIAALNEITAGQLDEYVGLWSKKSELAATQASRELAPLKEETKKTIEELRKNTEVQLEALKTEWSKAIQEIRYGTKEGFVGLDEDMSTVGKNVIDGLMKGLEDSESPLYAKVQSIAQGIAQSIKSTLKIKSPSRVLMSLGMFAGQGLAKGLSNARSIVGDKSKELALRARDSINKFISGVQSPDMDNEIHFKAVLDDSAIKNGTSNLKGSVPFSLGTTNNLMSSVKAGLGQNRNNPNSVDTSQSSISATTGQGSNQPIIIQSILNGRIIAEETFNDVSQLITGRTNLDYIMKGV